VNGLPDSVSGNAMRLTCKPSATDVYIAQDINARGAKGDVFTVSGWCNSLSVASGYSTFQPRIGVRFRTGSGSEYSGWQRFNFSTNRSGWNCISAQVAAPKDFYSIQIGVFYGRNANTGMFSHISLTRELYGNVYTYDANGNVTAVKDLSNQKSAATYDSFDNLLSYVQPGSAATEKYLFTYGTTDAEKKRHLPLTSTTPTGVKTTTEYNAYGSAVNATVQENASAPLIRTETEYTEDGNFVTKQRDARGNEVTNTLDANGKLLSVTDPAGQSVSYSYDASNRVTSVQSSYTVNGEERVSRNEYTYENDRLKTVAHNTTGNAADVVYNFEYDELGRKTTVKVGEQALSTNVYSPDRKNRLEEVQYGNGGKVKYTYDDFDRVTGVGYDNDESPRFSYEYDSKGRAAFVKDSTDGSTIRTGYDQTDRPNETEQRDGDGNLKYRTLIEYDKKNRVKAFNEATADANFKTEYTYDADNRVTKVRYNSSDTSKVDYVYDKLNRITSRTVTNGTSSYATQFAYAPGATTYGENVTAPLVNSITQGEGENAMNFAYTYDNRGNITSETRNGLSTTYVYDALGQFVRVNDPHENATWIYSYDRGGNILNKAKYAYTTADELGEALESIPYTYGDANWKDKLTAYNGVPITYDAIGNPLNDGTWTYEWQAGRQLKRMANIVTGVTMEFAYNDSGVRTKKVKKVNGVLAETTEYLVNGKNIVDLIHIDHVAEVTDRMHFSYDALGEVTRVEHNGTVYTYVQNLQGDIAGILDSNGNLVVKYEYDAWGKQLLTEGLLANVLGRDNPFRYRGYVYDEETGIYYLFNRYYSPEMERWINADRVISGTGGGVLGNNVFAYCINSPINMSDATGNWPKWLEKAVKVVSVAVVAVAVVTTAVAVSAFTAGTGSVIAVYGASVLLGAALSGINGGIANESNGNSYANGYVGGFFSGAIQSLASWFSGGTIWGGALGSSVGTAVTMALNNADPDSADSSLSEIAVSGLKSGLKALVTSSITAFVGYAVGGVSYKKKILEGAVVNGCNGLMPSLTPAFGEGIKSFFGAVDDALVYAWE
jgi:RHS repeat-associated protein